MAYQKITSEALIELGATDTQSSDLIISKDIALIVVQLIFPSGAGEAKIQTSLATVSEIKAGTTVAADWDEGLVIANTGQVTADAPAAIRVLNTGGTAVNLRYRGNFGT